MNPEVDWFFEKATKWQEEYAALRTIVLESGLTEALKWGVPCYTLQGKNIVLIHGFKEYCALLFHKGVLLKDVKGILVQQTENVQAARQIRFTSVEQIVNLKAIIKTYVNEAIKVENAGLKVEMKKTTEFRMPEEFQYVLEEMPELKKAFFGLTPGRQGGDWLYVSHPGQSQSRVARRE
ncbi:MAG: DUF1801 domain-containing protein, partial [Bacteroidetes bacterium]|nr:DUF1801 domain-containing protein [Bacteroidota bacterium]